MATRLTYHGHADAVELLVGDGRYASVRNAELTGDAIPAHVRDLEASIVLSDELAADLLGPEGGRSNWRKAGGQATDEQALDDPSHPTLRPRTDDELERVEPVTGYIPEAEVEALIESGKLPGPPAEGITEDVAAPDAQGVGVAVRETGSQFSTGATLVAESDEEREARRKVLAEEAEAERKRQEAEQNAQAEREAAARAEAEAAERGNK